MKYNPWKPSLDTISAVYALVRYMGIMGLCAVLLWFLA